MKKMSFISKLLVLVLSSSVHAQMPKWSYDAGPNPETQMGRELIDITASIPNMPVISDKIMGRKQKFRPAFGPIPWRMRQEENAVKILFMGQDGTHIAEAAGRPATAGFGGRAQDFANYFGVNEGAAFMNAYSFTIKGQYGVYGSPYLFTKNGKTSVRTANLVSNQLWLMSNDLSSPIVKWRNSLIDWIIRNNKDSMKLIVLFGGAARDAVATYAKSKGAEVFGRYEDDMKYIQVPEMKEEYAGGNNTFPSLVAQDGGDLYEDIVGERLDYKNSRDQKKALDSLKDNVEEYMKNGVFTKGGPHENGLLNAAQIGGYDLDTMKLKGITTRSLKGITLDDGTVLENDLVIISLPHPSYLSRIVMDADSYTEGKRKASETVMRDVKVLDKYKENGWEIKPDLNKVNHYHAGRDYEYGRADIGPEFYDFGTPENRMVSRSTARRMSGNANVVIIGTRDNGRFSRTAIKEMTNAKKPSGINSDDLYIARPRNIEDRYTFDPGPGAEMAKIMKENLDLREIFKTKDDMSFDKDGIAAYNVKTHPDVGDFGHYRGTFNNPKVVILADPVGYDDIVTARALTGTRGQYLQGVMNDLGIDDQYLVIKTVPFGMDGATDAEYKTVLEQTKTYREKVLAQIMKNGEPNLIIADGKYAAMEANRILGDAEVKIIETARDNKDLGADIKDLGEALQEELGLEGKITAKMANIPRSHLSFYARVWEGTSGDRVITSAGKEYEGIAFAEVVPAWAYKQKSDLTTKSDSSVDEMLNVLRSENLPLPGERIPEYLERVEIDPSLAFVQNLKNWFGLVA